MNLRNIDLNLLPVFEAIYAERSLTRASEVLNVTQPAVSNALARLRAHFDDALFVRAGRSVKPTSAAEALIGPVRAALDQLRDGLEIKARFDAALSTRTFNVSAGDTAAFMLAPTLAQRLEASAPGVRIHWSQTERAAIPLDLGSGRLDLAIDIPELAGADLESEPILSERYVCVMRPAHPALRRKLDLDRFAALRHVTVSSRRGGRSIVEDAVRRHGRRLGPVMRLPHYMPAFHAVMTSDAVLAAPEAMARVHDVAVRALPFDAPRLTLSLFRRRTAGEDPGVAWLRREIVAAAGCD
ncbi:MAG: LysR family transcriptional regulator [Maricaulaceae bacterium]|jgi:DNA-binding transcriptional LysR family regulator